MVQACEGEVEYKENLKLDKRNINDVKILRTMSKTWWMNGFKSLEIQYGKSLKYHVQSAEFEDKKKAKTIVQRLDM